ncbi:WHG domain-containing protein [Clostridiaceae bacterium]|nr:WHG domain-containing protein [Clostridiaceae bacterium]
MDGLKKEFLDFAYKFYEQYVADYSSLANVSSYLLLPLSYIAFAQEETQLFKLLFIKDMDLDMVKAKDFYKEIGNEKKAEKFSDTIGMDLSRGKAIFLDLFLYTHGIAVLTATSKLSLSRDDIETMVMNLLTALVKKQKPDWDLPV